jgi:hypothetical protein
VCIPRGDCPRHSTSDTLLVLLQTEGQAPKSLYTHCSIDRSGQIQVERPEIAYEKRPSLFYLFAYNSDQLTTTPIGGLKAKGPKRLLQEEREMVT